MSGNLRCSVPSACDDPRIATRSRLRRLLQPYQGSPDIFSSERSFAPPLGTHLGSADRPRGYYIDFSIKADEPAWPPASLEPPEQELPVATVQWGLGAWERYLKGEGEAWRRVTLDCAEHLLRTQEGEGAHDGAWLHWTPMPHTYRIDPPWASAIAQGEAASLFVRLHLETGDERFALAARRALRPMTTPTRAGGLMAEIDGHSFYEEYPTRPVSMVLNGGIFALWGFHDVARALDDPDASDRYEAGIEGLLSVLGRYDTGYWSCYDLYPHPVVNVASPAYHLLHINQLAALHRLTPRPQLELMRARFEAYRQSPPKRRRALAMKVAFRLATPRNRVFARRLPWNRWSRRDGGGEDLLVLAYHAVSEDWPATLAVTPAQLSEQLRYLLDTGYRPCTFTEGVLGPRSEKTFVVTFDDSYASVPRVALPILEELGVTGTVFVPTAYAGRAEPMSWAGIDRWKAGPHGDELRPARWEELEQLSEAGWEIGSHTRTHPRLTGLSDPELMAELRGSRGECERRLGRACLSLAYPYGNHDPRVVRAAGEAGFATAATMSVLPGTPLSWPRVGIYDLDDLRRFKLKVSRMLRAVRGSRIASMVSIASGLAPTSPGSRAGQSPPS